MQLTRCRLVLMIAFGVMCSGALAADTATSDKSTKDSTKPSEVKVSLVASDTKVVELLGSLAKQSEEKIVVETTVKGTIASLSLKDVSLEAALTAVCNAGKVVWRKVYISPDSKLLEQPDRFASTVRLLAGLSFPDMVVAGSSTESVAAHISGKDAVAKTRDSLSTELGMAKVYLIANDAAAAAKAMAKQDKDSQNKSEAVEKYSQMQKDQMDMFLKMSPEEREQALLSSIDMMDQIGPNYMSSVMQTLMDTDPENLKRLMSRQTEALFNMTTEQRRSMIKMNMTSMGALTPDQQKMLQEDAMAVMKEMGAQAPTGKP